MSVVVFGGNGFVGAKIVQELCSRGVTVFAVSRSGKAPSHIAGETWAGKVEWTKGDALLPETYADIMKDAKAIIVSVGSPPVPVSKDKLPWQIKMNGETNAVPVATAESAGVPRVVLINATTPEWAPTGYREGKSIAEAAAKDFSEGAEGNGAVVLKPGAVFGTRYAGGMPIPLGLVLGPVSWVMQSVPGIVSTVTKAAPFILDGALVPPASVDNVAAAAVDGALEDKFAGQFTVVSPQELATYAK